MTESDPSNMQAWALLREQLHAFVNGAEPPSLRSVEFSRLMHAIGTAAAEPHAQQMAILGNVALAAMLRRVVTAARSERQAALLIEQTRRT